MVERPKWKEFEVRHVCLTCGEEIRSEERRKHRMAHIRNGDVWSAQCKLDNSGNALCIDKEHYDIE